MRAVHQEEFLKPNYYALYVAIKGKVSVSKACSLMGISTAKGTKNSNYSNRYDIKEDEILEMIELKKEGKSYQEIGERFMITKGAVFSKLKRHYGGEWDNRPW
ncbi:hypothetical protein [Orenia marismortui]|uniref:Uncharacterized protein n=1 Tax=Orenia marismortui TaxID=46469 RepID=A0A4R8GR35_9FIRM|nr:hypothetical protein [Orenia marismortui]TDX48301.1 hypothetical protein C7959_13028 [Orenia marismortui]